MGFRSRIEIHPNPRALSEEEDERIYGLVVSFEELRRSECRGGAAAAEEVSNHPPNDTAAAAGALFENTDPSAAVPNAIPLRTFIPPQTPSPTLLAVLATSIWTCFWEEPYPTVDLKPCRRECAEGGREENAMRRLESAKMGGDVGWAAGTKLGLDWDASVGWIRV